jgi:hypothetical protein
VKKLVLPLVAIATFGTLMTAPVQAGQTCAIIPAMCPPAPPGVKSGRVPEPETLTLLAVGAVAAGLAARRRRNK